MIEGPRSRHLFVGLGNPGKKYANTRHNLGFLVVEELARSLGWPFKAERHFSSLVSRGFLEEREVHLLMPQTYVNVSGPAVRQYMEYYKLMRDQLLVVCDDTVLEFGQLRLRSQGSSGGHNGLKSVIAFLGSEKFARLRMGVGSPKEPAYDLADYVLGEFVAQERAALADFIAQGASVLKALVFEDLAKVMNRVNTTPKKTQSEP